jgi:hypothetical protein
MICKHKINFGIAPCILNFADAVFEAKVAPAKDLRQQKSAGMRQKIPSLIPGKLIKPGFMRKLG